MLRKSLTLAIVAILAVSIYGVVKDCREYNKAGYAVIPTKAGLNGKSGYVLAFTPEDVPADSLIAEIRAIYENQTQ